MSGDASFHDPQQPATDEITPGVVVGSSGRRPWGFWSQPAPMWKKLVKRRERHDKSWRDEWKESSR